MGALLLAVLVLLGLYAALTIVEAWFLMIFAGAVHHDVFPWVPALSFHDSWLVMGLVSAVFLPITLSIAYNSKS